MEDDVFETLDAFRQALEVSTALRFRLVLGAD